MSYSRPSLFAGALVAACCLAASFFLFSRFWPGTNTLPTGNHNIANGSFSIIERMEIGSGLIAPQTMLAGRHGPRSAIIATGRGELFGVSSIYEVAMEERKVLAGPVAVCRNIMSMATVGGFIAAACRGSNEVVLIDAATFAIAHRLPLPSPPVSVTSGDAAVFCVATANGNVFRFEKRDNNDWRQTRHRDTGKSIRAILAIGDAVYVTLPNDGQIARLDARSLQTVHTFQAAGSPSFKLALHNGRVLATNRDGYLHVIDPATNTIRTIDLFDIAGLHRAESAVRLLDATDLAVGSDGSVLVVMPVTDSMLLSQDFTLRRRVPRAGGGLALPGGAGFVLANPWTSAIWAVSANGDADLALQGQELVDMVGDPDGQNVALRTGHGGIYEVSPGRPLTQAPSHAVAMTYQNHQLILAGEQGHLLGLDNAAAAGMLADVSPISPVFSLYGMNDGLVAVGRLKDQAAWTDSSGHVDILTPSLKRARRAVVIDQASGRWGLIHDTHPDVGLTIWQRQQQVRAITSRELGLGSWFTDVSSCGNGQIAISTFAGDWAILDRDQKIVDRGSSGLRGVASLVCLPNRTLIVVSEEEERFSTVDVTTPGNSQTYAVPGLVRVLPAGPGQLHVATRTAYLKIQIGARNE
jgi:hypothetical protein